MQSFVRTATASTPSAGQTGCTLLGHETALEIALPPLLPAELPNMMHSPTPVMPYFNPEAQMAKEAPQGSQPLPTPLDTYIVQLPSGLSHTVQV